MEGVLKETRHRQVPKCSGKFLIPLGGVVISEWWGNWGSGEEGQQGCKRGRVRKRERGRKGEKVRKGEKCRKAGSRGLPHRCWEGEGQRERERERWDLSSIYNSQLVKLNSIKHIFGTSRKSGIEEKPRRRRRHCAAAISGKWRWRPGREGTQGVDGIGDVLKWKSLSQIKQDTDGENEEDLSNISLEFRWG